MPETPDVDVIVVGAGPAGACASIELARAGLQVVLLERGPFPGSKNMYGGVVYPRILDELIPNWWDEAPVQRWVTRRSTMVLTPTQALTVDFRSTAWGAPPYNGATAYRFDYQGKSCCYVTDTEHVPGKLDQVILDLIAGADLVIYDSTYTDKEYLSHVGWGHSTWQEGVRLCQAAGVKQYAIFHHDPDHDDEFMSHLESEAHHLWSGAFVARENMRVTLA